MAYARVVRDDPPPPPPIKEVVLCMTEAEAKHVRSVLGRVSPRALIGLDEDERFNSAVYNALANAGVEHRFCDRTLTD